MTVYKIQKPSSLGESGTGIRPNKTDSSRQLAQRCLESLAADVIPEELLVKGTEFKASNAMAMDIVDVCHMWDENIFSLTETLKRNRRCSEAGIDLS